MIQIPLIADVYFPRGETPVLEFQDVREAEQFLLYLQKRIDAKRARKKQRLEYYSDGIYFDGELLEIRSAKITAILRAFEFTDFIPKIDLISRVWNNPDISNHCFYMAISRFNKKMVDKGIYLESHGDYIKLNRP
ncbi:MAG: hypothetical protein IJG38_00020 [Thermoguttaceae bacterium]|nr:hypothetical protein [Thermoguttaceae bacterium]